MQATSNTILMTIKSRMNSMHSHWIRPLMLQHGIARPRQIQTQPTQTLVAQPGAPLSPNSTTGMAMESQTGTTSMTTTMESSMHSILTRIVTSTTTETFTPSTEHCTVTMDLTQSIPISTETVSKTTLTGMTTTTVSPTSTTLTMETVVSLITIRAMHLLDHITRSTMVATLTAAKTAPPMAMLLTITGTSSSGTTHLPMSCSTTTAMMPQLHQRHLVQFQNFTGSCLLDGHHTTVGTIGTLTPMEIHSQTVLTPIKTLMVFQIGGTKMKQMMESWTLMIQRWAVRSTLPSVVGLLETSVPVTLADTNTLWPTTCHSMV